MEKGCILKVCIMDKIDVWKVNKKDGKENNVQRFLCVVLFWASFCVQTIGRTDIIGLHGDR